MHRQISRRSIRARAMGAALFFMGATGLAGVACALGVIPRGDTETGLRIIFLMAVPDKADYDDRILLRVYDEIIRVSQDAALVRKISRLTSHVQLFYLMEDYSQATDRGRK